MILPNLFGPFANQITPFIATFSHNIINSISNKIKDDKNIPLLYVNDLVSILIKSIQSEDKIIKRYYHSTKGK